MKYELSCNAPLTEKELLKRAMKLAGKHIEEFRRPFDRLFDDSTKNSHGYFGKIMEIYLGASANNLPIPDFPNLNIELKTLPLNNKMLPKNDIKICSTSFFPIETNYCWSKSLVKIKIKKILLVPFQSGESLTYYKKKICRPFLFQLGDYEKIIKQDYENIIECLFLGKLGLIPRNLGKYLVLKSSSSNKNLTNYINSDQELVRTNFVGFYLKKSFLKRIMYENLNVQIPKF